MRYPDPTQTTRRHPHHNHPERHIHRHTALLVLAAAALLSAPSTIASPTSAQCSPSLPCEIHVTVQRNADCSAVVTELMIFLAPVPFASGLAPRGDCSGDGADDDGDGADMLRDVSHFPTFQTMTNLTLHRRGTPVAIRTIPCSANTSAATLPSSIVVIPTRAGNATTPLQMTLQYRLSHAVMRFNTSCDAGSSVPAAPADAAANILRWRAGLWGANVVPLMTMRLLHVASDTPAFANATATFYNGAGGSQMTAGRNVTLRDVASDVEVYVVERGAPVCPQPLRCFRRARRGQPNVGWILLGIISLFWVVGVCVAMMTYGHKQQDKQDRGKARNGVGGVSMTK